MKLRGIVIRVSDVKPLAKVLAYTVKVVGINCTMTCRAKLNFYPHQLVNQNIAPTTIQ